MVEKLEKILEQHRVIGIKHTLKAFKNDGLIDDEINYPDDAVNEIKDSIVEKSKKWYRIGAKRGALEALEAIIQGNIKVKKNKDGTYELTAYIDSLEWERELKVTVGDEQKKVKRQKYKISTKALGFE